jgi:anti-sigma factor RsiW
MHQEISKDLEEYLKGSRAGVPAEFHRHLGECARCAEELQQLELQAQALRALQNSAEPRVGFYARVRERIEAQQKFTIWSVFLEPRFGFRLAVASGMLAGLLGIYLVTSEPGGPETVAAPTVASAPVNSSFDQAGLEQDGPRQQLQRDAVLVDLASYRQ